MSLKTFITVAASIFTLMGPSLTHAAETIAYTYDAHGRLSTVDKTSSTSSSSISTYAYDRSNNRMVVTTTDRSTGLVPTFRFYDGRHFYTRSFPEGINAGLSSKGVAFKAFAGGGAGLHALYRCLAGSDRFVSTASNCEGWTTEDVLGFAYTSPGAGLVPLYRFYSAAAADHLITTDYSESIQAGYSYEFILGYVPQ